MSATSTPSGTMPARDARTPARWTVMLIAVSTAVRTLLAALVPPLGDEAYHWYMGIQFQLSYDHPPLTYWLAAVGHHLAPHGGFLFPRMPFVLLFSASTWLVFLVSRVAFGGMAGFYAAVLFTSAPYFFIGAGVAALPEGPLTFGWLLCLWVSMRLFFSPSPSGAAYRWAGLGAAFGLAFLAKYHAVFIPVGAGLFVMTDPAARRRVKGVGPILALTAAVVVALPVVAWNYRHGWMSFSEFLHRGLTARELQLGDAARNLGGQALLLLPGTWALLVWHLARGLAPRRQSPTAAFLALMAVGPLVLFTAASAINGEWYQFHWPIVGYASLFPLAGAALAGAVGRAAVRAKWLAVSSTITTAAVAGGILVFATTSLPDHVSAFMPDQAPPRSMVRNYDLSAYAGLDDALSRRGFLTRTNLFVSAGNYMDCGRLAWVLRDRLPVLCVAGWDEAKSFLFLPTASGRPGADALLVSRDADVTSDLASAQPFFSRATPVGSVTVGHGAHRTTLRLHLLEGMSRPFPAFSAPTRDWEPSRPSEPDS